MFNLPATLLFPRGKEAAVKVMLGLASAFKALYRFQAQTVVSVSYTCA